MTCRGLGIQEHDSILMFKFRSGTNDLNEELGIYRG